MYFVLSCRSEGNLAEFLHFFTFLHKVHDGEKFCLYLIFTISLLGYFFNQTDSYFLFYPVSWNNNNSAGGFRKNISGLSLFQRKNMSFNFLSAMSPKGLFWWWQDIAMGGSATAGSRPGESLQLWEFPGLVSHSPQRAAGWALRTWHWGSTQLHVCCTCALPAGLFFSLYCSCLQPGITFGSWVLIFGCFLFNVAIKADIFPFLCTL